jgi:hypothetical protein
MDDTATTTPAAIERETSVRLGRSTEPGARPRAGAHLDPTRVAGARSIVIADRRIMSCVLGTLLLVGIPGIAGGQSPSPSTVPAGATATPSTSSEPAAGVRVGWSLWARQAPAVSIQLPAGWHEVVGDALFMATGPAGETLELATGPVSDDADFDAYVARVEKGLEKSRKQQIPTVFRATSSGLVARLDQARRRKENAADQTSLFLYPSCVDGNRTLTIAGTLPEPATEGSPDAWDAIAAAVSPCTVDAAPESLLSPEVVAVGQQYFTLLTEINGKATAIDDAINRANTVAVWRKQARKMAALLTDASRRVAALPWTEETRPLADALLTAYADEIPVWVRIESARSPAAIEGQFDDLDRVGTVRSAAGRAIRLAAGLPTVAQ